MTITSRATLVQMTDIHCDDGLTSSIPLELTMNLRREPGYDITHDIMLSVIEFR